MKSHQLIICLMAAIPGLTFAQGALENPVAGGTESGIGVISGWHCTASNITAEIDGASLGKAGSGTDRGDTASICGRADTGFSLLFNYNALTPGSHSISVYADGQLLETRQFNAVQSGGAEFVTGMSKTATISDFPSAGKTATLQWSQAKQGFVVTGISAGSTGSGAVDMSSLQGIYIEKSYASVSGNYCSSYGASSGNTYSTFSLKVNGNTATVDGTLLIDQCVYTLTYASGDITSGLNFSGSAVCLSNIAVSGVTATNIKKINNQIDGTFTVSYPGCDQSISLSGWH